MPAATSWPIIWAGSAVGSVNAIGPSGLQTIPGQAATPGWKNVNAWPVGDSVPGTAVLEAVLAVSDPALSARARLFNETDNAVVAGSTTPGTSSLTDARVVSADFAGVLLPNKMYAIQVECTGGATQNDFAVCGMSRVYSP